MAIIIPDGHNFIMCMYMSGIANQDTKLIQHITVRNHTKTNYPRPRHRHAPSGLLLSFYLSRGSELSAIINN